MPARPEVLVSEDISGTDATSWGQFRGHFNISLSGFNGHTVELQRSFDDGTTPLTLATYTEDTEDIHYEPEEGIVYRVEITGAGTGSVAARLSK